MSDLCRKKPVYEFQIHIPVFLCDTPEKQPPYLYERIFDGLIKARKEPE